MYDDSNTDWTCTKFDIQVQGVLNIDYIEVISELYAGITTPDNAAAIMKRIRADLMQPRRHLSFTFNGVELIPGDTASPGLVDVKNGPQPQSCQISQLSNTTFLIIYHIIAHYWEHNQVGDDSVSVTNLPGHPALYNRWTETVDIAKDMSSTRTREGKYIIRSDNAQGLTADELRSQLAVIGCPDGFIRESARYTISPDGLALQYSIVDKEIFKYAPYPAFEGSGELTLSSTNLGAKTFGDVRVRLRGAPDENISPPAQMLLAAITMGMRRLQKIADTMGSPADTKKAKMIRRRAAITVNLFENEVSFECQVQYTAKDARIEQWAAFTGVMTERDESQIRPGLPYLDRGSFGLLLQAAKYWDPSIPDTKLVPDVITAQNNNTSPDNYQHNHGVKIGQAGIVNEVANLGN